MLLDQETVQPEENKDNIKTNEITLKSRKTKKEE